MRDQRPVLRLRHDAADGRAVRGRSPGSSQTEPWRETGSDPAEPPGVRGPDPRSHAGWPRGHVRQPALHCW